MKLEQLEQQVIQWAEDKGIFTKATAYKQAQKTLEETGELLHAVGKQDIVESLLSGEPQHEYHDKEVKEEIQDAIGDIAVTIIIQAHMQGLTLEECLQSAYNVISKRTGQMINGQFVKDA
jgi:NTP pyrophosphatase (non-canonical NTP hydrolase)